jgi:hypothetical protein
VQGAVPHAASMLGNSLGGKVLVEAGPPGSKLGQKACRYHQGLQAPEVAKVRVGACIWWYNLGFSKLRNTSKAKPWIFNARWSKGTRRGSRCQCPEVSNPGSRSREK